MRLIIAGSRDFNDYALLKHHADDYRSLHDVDLEIVSGMARGADMLGVRYATEHNLILHKFPANWDLYGKSAGYKRNEQMAAFATSLLAFSINNSRGTGHMIDIMRRLGKTATVVSL